MAFDETGLTKGQVRKLNALRKSVGDDLGEQTFAKWMKRTAIKAPKAKSDPVAEKIAAALDGLRQDRGFRLGNYGYTVRRTRGRGAGSLVARKNTAKSER